MRTTTSMITTALVALLPCSGLAVPMTSNNNYDWGFTLWGGDNCDGFEYNFLGHSTRACQAVDVFKSWQRNTTVSTNKVVRLYSATDCTGAIEAKIGADTVTDACQVLEGSPIQAFDIVDADI